MNPRFIIRHFTAGLLLLLFAFSITPKQTLHDWLADHKDSVHPKCNFSDVTHFGAYEFHCDCDNLVAESPFTSTTTFFSFGLPSVYAGSAVFIPHRYYAETSFFFSLRGPPSGSSLS